MRGEDRAHRLHGERRVECGVCFRRCRLAEGETGFCGARQARAGKVICANYGKLTALALDPIEKKPLAEFYPGNLILSAGSFGCNLRCPFCQNYEISMAGIPQRSGSGTWGRSVGAAGCAENGSAGPAAQENAGNAVGDAAGDAGQGAVVKSAAGDAGQGAVKEVFEEPAAMTVSPRQLAAQAAELAAKGNIGLAYTYNEPLVGWEFVRDCAGLIAEAGMKNVLVTNGTAGPEVLDRLLPLIDAVNIDLKGFTQEYYSWVGGSLDMVKETIIRASQLCHTEVTVLIVPGKNDDEEDMRRLAGWLSSVEKRAGKRVPLHVTRFFPRWRMKDQRATPVETVYGLAETAREYLPSVYTGNC
ncbi:radical SAM protein [Bacilliculturomica massiliensis]|uniref:radical SAM protein n=1 Tax=Bacilliculturomica massiliensis TaxID=1917867 RepID=UPI00102F7470|nr:radical SAM protein [Bacilliculturomica massiliensis]